MSKVNVRGRTVDVFEAGEGRALVYLHGIADLHGASAGPLAFHSALAGSFRLIAPAHPGCAGTDEDPTLESMEDLVFHTIEVLDALGLNEIDLLGTCIGGWLAAEIAVRHPERVRRLALIGASGLFLSGQPIADLFMAAQPRNGGLADLRAMLIGDPADSLALTLIPDDHTDHAGSLMRYKAFRFAARVGFTPPYFHHPKLRQRLYRFGGDALVIHGSADPLVPLSHAEIYAAGFPHGELMVAQGAAHSPHLTDPGGMAGRIQPFFAR